MQDDSGSKLSDRLNVIFIDLEAIRLKLGTPIAKLTPIEKWGLFFCYVDHDNQADYIRNLVDSEDGIMAADEIIRHMSKADSNWFTQNSIYMAECDSNTIKAILKQEILEEGIQKGIVQGIEQGEQKAKIEAALNLLRMNVLTPEQIAKAQGLPLNKVLELQKEATVNA